MIWSLNLQEPAASSVSADNLGLNPSASLLKRLFVCYTTIAGILNRTYVLRQGPAAGFVGRHFPVQPAVSQFFVREADSDLVSGCVDRYPISILNQCNGPADLSLRRNVTNDETV